MGERRKKRFVDPSKGHPNDKFYGVPLWMRRLEKKMAKRRDPNEVVDVDFSGLERDEGVMVELANGERYPDNDVVGWLEDCR